MSKLRALVIALAFSWARGHVAYYNSPNHLHPVQGLYVKPSEDGTTGDLYVAATEDSGVKTQWLTDQPVNFLPSTTAAQPVTPYTNLAAVPHGETTVTSPKRAVVTSPTVKYAYALPGASNDGNAVVYPYAIPVSKAPASPTEGATESSAPASPICTQYNPYQYYYPQMFSAFANAVTAMKEAGLGEDGKSSVASQSAPLWPYTYPAFQYVMVDPATWAQAQATTQVASSEPSSQPTTSTDNSEAASHETD